MRYLITGASGQLALEFLRVIDNKDVHAYPREKLDITNESDVKDVIELVKPDIIINCASYNKVDDAELNYSDAFNVNSMALNYLVKYSMKYNTKLIHFSTDYVFDGLKNTPYTETDAPHPLNNYGKTKLYGEKNIIDNYDNFIIFRVSWLYGRGRQNFIYKLTQWTKSLKEIKISVDEISVPTSTEFVVEMVIKSINNDIRGLFHLVPSGFASRYIWAEKFIEISGIDVRLIKGVQSDFKLPAKRPSFSAMDNRKISDVLGVKIEGWDYYLEKYLREVYL